MERAMLDQKIRKIFLASLGGIAMTGDKLDALKNKLVREKKMSEKEAKSLIDELVEAGESQWKEFEKAGKDMLRRKLDSMDVPDRKELEELKARVDNLERRISALEGVSPVPEPTEPA
jgi:polyhydroxyalkanoate synthesis regulator phasin